jgi:hypothetical protein
MSVASLADVNCFLRTFDEYGITVALRLHGVLVTDRRHPK